MAARKLDVIQGTPAWHAERKLRIGSSDAPIIMKQSPWATPYDLWISKLGLKPHKKARSTNFAIELGKKFEAAAVALYELLVGIDFEPVTFVKDDICAQIASLDGWNQPRRINLEVKCVQGGPTWEKAVEACKKIESSDGTIPLDGWMPSTYKPQVYHQMHVADAEETHFLVCKVGRANGVGHFVILDHRVIVVKRDESYEKDLMIAEKGFSDMVKGKIRPPLEEKDTLVADDQSTVLLFSRLKRKKLELKRASEAEQTAAAIVAEAKREFEEVKEEAIEHCLHELSWHKVHAIGVDLRRDKNGIWSVFVDDEQQPA